jgi:hypothetical protein
VRANKRCHGSKAGTPKDGADVKRDRHRHRESVVDHGSVDLFADAVCKSNRNYMTLETIAQMSDDPSSACPQWR